MKTCPRCKEEKDESYFCKDKATKSGLACWCKECMKTHKSRKQSTEERRKYVSEYRRRPGKAAEMLLKNTKYRAKKRGIDFSIDIKDIIIPERCPVLGIEFQFGNDDGSPRASDAAPSLDRVDNAKGYVPGNVRVISWRANRLKNDATIEEMTLVLKYMKEA